MTNYRRQRIPGASYFFTLAMADRSRTTLTDEIVALRRAYALTCRERPFHTDAIVILPDHLHAVWTLPVGDADFSTRWRLIKARFSRELGEYRPRSRSQATKQECGIWQRRFWEHRIRDVEDHAQHVRYCWANPVRHGLVEVPSAWPHSSIHRDIRARRVEPEWAMSVPDGGFGEPQDG